MPMDEVETWHLTFDYLQLKFLLVFLYFLNFLCLVRKRLEYTTALKLGLQKTLHFTRHFLLCVYMCIVQGLESYLCVYMYMYVLSIELEEGVGSPGAGVTCKPSDMTDRNQTLVLCKSSKGS